MKDSWKSVFISELEKFWVERGSYEKIIVPNTIKNDKVKSSSLIDTLLQLNKINPAIFFVADKNFQYIHCYGHRNPVLKRIQDLFHKFPALQLSSSQTTPQLAVMPLPPTPSLTPSPPPPTPPSKSNGVQGIPNFVIKRNGNEATIDLSARPLLCSSLENKQLLNDFL